MFIKKTKILALALVVAIAVCNLASCDMIFKKQCDHDYGDWEVTKEPTCTKKGKKTKTCEICGEEKTKSIEKLEHDFELSGICKNCGINEDDVETPTGGHGGNGYPTEPPIEYPTGGNGYPTEPPMEYPTDVNDRIDYTYIYTGYSEYVYAKGSDNYTYFAFIPSESGTYIFSSSNNSYSGYNVDVYAVLYDRYMCELQGDDDSGDDLNFYLSYYLVAGETYYLATTSYDSYDMYYNVCVDKYMFESYTDIYVDYDAPVDIYTYGETKMFRFIPNSDGIYTFYGESYYYVDSYAYLLDDSGNTLYTDDSSGNDYHFCITANLTAGETYYIETGIYSVDSGSYNLCIRGCDSMLLNYGMDVYADAIPQYFKFVPSESGLYSFYSYDNVDSNGDYIDSVGDLYDSSFNNIASNDDGNGNYNFLISAHLEAGEVYYLKVNEPTNSDCYYKVCAEYEELGVECSYIAVGDEIPVKISSSYDSVPFKFVPEESGHYTFYGNSASYVDSYAYLYNSNGDIIGTADTGGSFGHFSITEYFVAGEKYYISAAMSGTRTGSYHLCLVKTDYDLGINYTDIHAGDTDNVPAYESDKYTYFRFIPEYSGTYVFRSTENYDLYSGGYIDTCAELLDNNLNVLATDDNSGDNGNFYLSYYLEAGQTYYFAAANYGAYFANYYVVLDAYY